MKLTIEQFDLLMKRIVIKEEYAYNYIINHYKELEKRYELEELARQTSERNLRLKLQENRGPKWREHELNELGYTLRNHIESKQTKQNYLEERLNLAKSLGKRVKKVKVKKLCIECNKEYETNRENQSFCSSKCRFTNWDKLHPRVDSNMGPK